MALGFNQSKGGAQKDRADSYDYKDGENTVRMVGDLLARYVYWIKGENNKNLPFECLAFNRETETFDNSEKDAVKEFFPDLKCSWAYAIQCIANPGTENPELKILNLKKKLMKQILDAAEDLGDLEYNQRRCHRTVLLWCLGLRRWWNTCGARLFCSDISIPR